MIVLQAKNINVQLTSSSLRLTPEVCKGNTLPDPLRCVVQYPEDTESVESNVDLSRDPPVESNVDLRNEPTLESRVDRNSCDVPIFDPMELSRARLVLKRFSWALISSLMTADHAWNTLLISCSCRVARWFLW